MQSGKLVGGLSVAHSMEIPTSISRTSDVSVHWFRRDLRIDDNPSLNAALHHGRPVVCLFIFDTEIIDQLPRDDARVTFIHKRLEIIDDFLKSKGSALVVRLGKPVEVWRQFFRDFKVASIDVNEDYEPYGMKRDNAIRAMARGNNCMWEQHMDHVMFRPGTVLKDDGTPYSVYTPFMKRLRSHAGDVGWPSVEQLAEGNFLPLETQMPSLDDIGFRQSTIDVPDFAEEYIEDYDKHRNDPAAQKTTYAGTHLRFGSLSIRQAIDLASNETYLNELIWREFFINILYHYPRVVGNNFRPQYDSVEWRNDETEFRLWCEGKTGFPMVDAGMRQLNETGYMHNRVRMIAASFLCKDLLVDWRWGEAYFAEKLLDFELASNNGNWQWAAGTGCDAAPYFRVFNPESQLKKFDPEGEYVRRWLPGLDTFEYPEPMVDHKMARERALEAYKTALNPL